MRQYHDIQNDIVAAGDKSKPRKTSRIKGSKIKQEDGVENKSWASTMGNVDKLF